MAKRRSSARPVARRVFRPSSPRRFTAGGSRTLTSGGAPSVPGVRLPSVALPSTPGAIRSSLDAKIAKKKGGGLMISPEALKASLNVKRLPTISPDVLRAFAGKTGSQIRETEGGYSYPEIPQETEQGIPDYYSASRSKRGLPRLPPEAGNLARKIGRYVANLPNDPDNRGSIEGTIAQVLAAASQEADAQGDAENAGRLAKIAGEWAKLIRSKGLQAPDPDAPLPLAGYDYGDARSLPEGWSTKSVTVLAFGSGAVYGAVTCRSRDDGRRAMRGLLFGGAAAAGAHLLLRALGYDDAA